MFKINGIKKTEFLPNRDFMVKAIELAQKCVEHGDVPVGAIIEKNGVIVGKGRNMREQKQSSVSHAEIKAISDACKTLGTWRLDGCNMYVTLSPCPMCAGAAVMSRISRVIYGADDDKGEQALDIWRRDGNQSVCVYRNFMQEECKRILKDFFDNIRTQEKPD